MGKFTDHHRVQRALRLWRRVRQLHIPQYAANAGFFLMLSLFPGLLLLLGLLRYTPVTLERFLALVRDFLPASIFSRARSLIQSAWENSGGANLGISAAAALWSAGRGMQGLVHGLEAVEGNRRPRRYIRDRLVGIWYIFLFFGVLMATLVLHVFGSTLIRWVSRSGSPLLRWIDLRFFLLLGLQTFAFTLMYMAAPGGGRGLGRNLPGGVFSALGWLSFSDLYAIYVENFSRYANIYGSVYAVAISMLWLYICLSILLYGAVLNRYLAEGEDMDFL